MQYEMEDSTPNFGLGYKFSSDDTKSLSSLSSACSSSHNCSLDSFVSEDNKKVHISPAKGEKHDGKNIAPNEMFINDELNPLNNKFEDVREGVAVHRRKVELKEGSPNKDSTKSDKSDPCNVSFGLGEDDWTTQGNRTEKTGTTGTTGTTGNTFYTGLTDATGATKLHQNGVSAMLHRKLKRNKSNRNKINASPVPTSIKTIRRPMSFDNRINSNSSDIIAPSELDLKTNYQKKIYTKTKLKDDPACRKINDEFNCMFSNDDFSTGSATSTLLEDADYHAGSKSVGGFFRSLFLCCHSDYAVGK